MKREQIDELADALCRWHEDPDEVGDYDAPCDACRVQARCFAEPLERFVAARVAEALEQVRKALAGEDTVEWARGASASSVSLAHAMELIDDVADSYDPAPVNADP